MNYDVRTKKTIEEGTQLREDRENSIFLSYAPGNGTTYLVLIEDISVWSPKMRGRVGLGDTGGGWLVTHLNGLPMASMPVLNNGELIHWGYIQEKLHVSISDAVVLAELIGYVTGRPYISCEEFLEEAKKNQEPSHVPCCERDRDKDGNCARHPGNKGPTQCKETYKSPAEESATKILQGIKIIQSTYPEVTLVGLDKGVFIGPCEDPMKDGLLSTVQLKQLEKLGFEWNREQESWEFYTGHG